jgi:hypothetical protein
MCKLVQSPRQKVGERRKKQEARRKKEEKEERSGHAHSLLTPTASNQPLAASR